jgi:hypothetical protein
MYGSFTGTGIRNELNPKTLPCMRTKPKMKISRALPKTYEPVYLSRKLYSRIKQEWGSAIPIRRSFGYQNEYGNRSGISYAWILSDTYFDIGLYVRLYAIYPDNGPPIPVNQIMTV